MRFVAFRIGIRSSMHHKAKVLQVVDPGFRDQELQGDLDLLARTQLDGFRAGSDQVRGRPRRSEGFPRPRETDGRREHPVGQGQCDRDDRRRGPREIVLGPGGVHRPRGYGASPEKGSGSDRDSPYAVLAVDDLLSQDGTPGAGQVDLGGILHR